MNFYVKRFTLHSNSYIIILHSFIGKKSWLS
ncbi:hypothetical protein BRC2024_ULFKEANI_CDS_0208 [Acinetobacter phage vB_AbaM_Konradin-v2]